MIVPTKSEPLLVADPGRPATLGGMPKVCVWGGVEAAALAPLPDGVSLTVGDGTGPLPRDVEFLVPAYPGGAMPDLADLPQLKVVQLLSAGVEGWPERVPANVLLCNGRGIHGASTAEQAVAGLLAVLRDLPRSLRQQEAHEWQRYPRESLDGKRVLLLGAGDVASYVERAVEVFGASTVRVARRPRAGVHGLAELPDLLPDTDIVVAALPDTAATRHLVDAAFLARLPDGAVVVNVGRGTLVDTDALLAELTAKRLRAFLDVVDPEPLPADHPLWSAPNVLLTPHVGGGAGGWERRAAKLVREQIERFVRGEPLINLVSSGY